MYDVVFLRLIVLVLSINLLVAPVSNALGFTSPPTLSNREKAARNIIFTGGGSTKSALCPSMPTSLSGNTDEERAQIVWDYLIKFMPAEPAAGAMGNISVESAGTFDPTIVEGMGHETDPSKISAGWGIIQWSPGSKIIGLLTKANITTPPSELGTQLALVRWHMENTSPTGIQNMLRNYQKITDVPEATRVYEREMEGAKVPHIEKRIERAIEAQRKYGGGSQVSTSSTNTTSSSGSCDGTSGGTASTGDFTFPLITTKAALNEGSKNGSGAGEKWCMAKLTSCHHDYNAADIMVATGTPVIAAKDGVVVSTNGGNQHPNNVTIKSSDGKGINYYTHMGANTLKVRDGQTIKAGDVLGEVGTSEDAMGTAPHLHFDMLPDNFKYRPSCSSGGCSGYPFIDVQSQLVEAYKLLPER